MRQDLWRRTFFKRAGTEHRRIPSHKAREASIKDRLEKLDNIDIISYNLISVGGTRALDSKALRMTFRQYQSSL